MATTTIPRPQITMRHTDGRVMKARFSPTMVQTAVRFGFTVVPEAAPRPFRLFSDRFLQRLIELDTHGRGMEALAELDARQADAVEDARVHAAWVDARKRDLAADWAARAAQPVSR
jgi:hypothetical protein